MRKRRIVLYPTGRYYIPGIRAVVTECDERTARWLLSHHPPAFTTAPPTARHQPTGPAEQVGPLDSHGGPR
jgi:hypothetical protein